jgi:hypothetical protein
MPHIIIEAREPSANQPDESQNSICFKAGRQSAYGLTFAWEEHRINGKSDLREQPLVTP